jgi:hypothetical protein
MDPADGSWLRDGDERCDRRPEARHRGPGHRLVAVESDGERLRDQAGVWRAVAATLLDALECGVIYLSCVAGLGPSEVARLDVAACSAVTAVYQRTRQALDRLRRDGQQRAPRPGAA